VVLKKMANIRKLLQRAVALNDKPILATVAVPSKRLFKSEKVSLSDANVASREISEIGVMNFLPCSTVQEIFDLENSMRVDGQIYEDVVTYIRVRRPFEENQLPTALRMVCSDEVLYQFNWGGLNGRKKISDLTIFSKIIFEEWYKDRMSLADYINEMKEALSKIHKRTQKKQSRWQRKQEDSDL
jgi:Domain of unknown function (DUF4806)